MNVIWFGITANDGLGAAAGRPFLGCLQLPADRFLDLLKLPFLDPAQPSPCQGTELVDPATITTQNHHCLMKPMLRIQPELAVAYLLFLP